MCRHTAISVGHTWQPASPGMVVPQPHSHDWKSAPFLEHAWSPVVTDPLVPPNTLMTGSLPPSWATQDAFQSLELLYLFNSRITGSLPPSWAKKGAFPKLVDLSLSNTLMTGSLPPSWGSGFPALETLVLGPSRQNGTLPAEWGSPGSFPHLTILQINGSNITGLRRQTLHCQCVCHPAPCACSFLFRGFKWPGV